MVKNFSNTVDLTKMGIPEMQKDISDLKSTVIDIPVPTVSDSGKALIVNDSGNWELGTVSNEDFIIRCRPSSGNRIEVIDYTSIGEATTSAINAHNQGKEVYVKIENYLGIVVFLKTYNITDTGLIISMPNFYVSNANKFINANWSFTSNRTQKWQSPTETDLGFTLPSVTSTDNGKLLQVVNGYWVAVDLDGNNNQF